MRCQGWLVAWVLGLLGACPSVARAEVFRCEVGGRVVYQDLSCDDSVSAGPYRAQTPQSIPAPPRDELPITTAEKQSGDLRELHQRLQAAVAGEQRVQADYAEALEAQREKARRQTNAAAEAEVKALDALWQRKRQRAEQQRQALVDELRRRCPGGSSLSDQKLVCF